MVLTHYSTASEQSHKLEKMEPKSHEDFFWLQKQSTGLTQTPCGKKKKLLERFYQKVWMKHEEGVTKIFGIGFFWKN